MHAQDEEFALAGNLHVTVLQIHLARPQGLDLRPLQLDARLHRLDDGIIMACLSVFRNDLNWTFHFTHCLFLQRLRRFFFFLTGSAAYLLPPTPPLPRFP